jgi:RNA methyltransferase, TrmH family
VGATSQVIQSRHNEQVKKLRRALQRGERTPEGLLALDTFHLLEEALASRLDVEQVFYTAEAEPALRATLEQFGAQPAMTRLPARLFESISAVPASQGVVALVRPRLWEIDDLFRPAPALVVVLAGVQDPGNGGTILRTAEAFGATGALLLHGTVHPENPKFLRASAGSVFRLPHCHGMKYGEALEALRQHGAHLYAAMPRARRTLRDVDFRRPVALAIGGEGAGVPDAIRVAAESVGIPHTARVESLNAAMAAGIFLYHAAGRRRG